MLPSLIRKLVEDASPVNKWIIFDGPGLILFLSLFLLLVDPRCAVDSLWIENMNTAMDQNKILFLTNGERIHIPSTMKFIFEVPNLNAATPGSFIFLKNSLLKCTLATVSRCGMVFMDHSMLDWKPLVSSWAERGVRNNPSLGYLIERLQSQFDSILCATLQFLKQNCKHGLALQLSENQLVMNFLKYVLFSFSFLVVGCSAFHTFQPSRLFPLQLSANWGIGQPVGSSHASL